MSLESHKIYVIIGSCGEYSDHTEWPVTWRSTLKEAEEVVAVLKNQATAYMEISDNNYRKSDQYFDYWELAATMLDPLFNHDFSGTSYHIWTISDDFTIESRPKKLTNEVIEYIKEKTCQVDGCSDTGVRLWDDGPYIYFCEKHYDKKAKLWFREHKRHPVNQLDALEYLSNSSDEIWEL